MGKPFPAPALRNCLAHEFRGKNIALTRGKIFPMWYSRLSMPDQKAERRTIRRVPVRVPVSIKSPQGERVEGYTRDLSMAGVFLYTDAQIHQGSELEMVLILPPELTEGEKRWVCCRASVIRVENKGDDPGFGVAASIQSMQVLPEITG